MTSYLFRSMQGVSLSDMKENSGTIVFSKGYVFSDDYRFAMRFAMGNINSAAIPTDRFLLIDGVDKVYRLIMEQIEAQK